MKIMLPTGLGLSLLAVSFMANAAESCPCNFKQTDFAINRLRGKAAKVELLQCVQDEKHLQIDIVEGSLIDHAVLTADIGLFGVQCKTTIVTKRKAAKAEHFKLTKLQALECMSDLRKLVLKFAQRFGTQVTGNCGL